MQTAQELLMQSPNVTVKKEDAHNLTFENETFDVVYSSLCLHIVTDPIKVLNEAFRVCFEIRFHIHILLWTTNQAYSLP